VSYDAGSIEARLDIDRTPFQQGMDFARQQGEDFDGKTFSANLDLDVAHAEEQLRRFREQLNRLDDPTSGPSIELDTAAASAKLRELFGMLERIDRFRATPRIDIDISGATHQLIELLGQLERIDRFRATPRVDLDGYALARAQIADLQRQLDQLSRTRATSTIGGLGSAMSRTAGAGGGLRSSLIGIAVALSPALIPVAEVATAGIVSLGGALTAAGAGAGVFGLAMKTNLGSVLDAVKKFKTEGLDAFKNLDEGQRGVAMHIVLLQQAWSRLADSVKPQTYQTAHNVLNGLAGALQVMRPLTTAAADAFERLSAGFARATAGDTFRGFVDFLARQAGPAIDTFGKALGDLLHVVAKVFEAFEPLIRPAENALLRFTGHLREWSDQLAGNQAFQRWLQSIPDKAHQVADSLGKLGGGLLDFIRALSQLGPPLLDAIGKIGQFISAVSKNDAFRAFVDVLKHAVDGFTALAGTDFGKISLGLLAVAAGFAAIERHPAAAAIIAAAAAIGYANEELKKTDDGKKTGFIGRIVDLFSAHNWSALGKDIDRFVGPNSSLGHALRFEWLGGALGSVQHTIGGFLSGIVNLFSAHNWKSLGSGLQDFIGGVLKGDPFQRTFNELEHNIKNWIHNAIGWGRDLIGGLVDGIKSGISSLLSGIGSWLSNAIFGPIKRALGIASPSTIMRQIGRDLIQGLIDGIRGALGGVISALSSLPGRIRSFFSGAGSWLLSHGRSLMSGLRNGIVAGYGAVSGWLGGIRGRITRFTSSAGSWIVSHGRSLMSGLRNGIVSGYGAVSGWLGGLRGRVTGFVGSAGSWIVSHGSALMHGFSSGISSGYGAVAGFLGSIPGPHPRVLRRSRRLARRRRPQHRPRARSTASEHDARARRPSTPSSVSSPHHLASTFARQNCRCTPRRRFAATSPSERSCTMICGRHAGKDPPRRFSLPPLKSPKPYPRGAGTWRRRSPPSRSTTTTASSTKTKSAGTPPQWGTGATPAHGSQTVRSTAPTTNSAASPTTSTASARTWQRRSASWNGSGHSHWGHERWR
jgi:hypothetical protein